jgi:NADH-quinone oxidoreductase subunit B
MDVNKDIKDFPGEIHLDDSGKTSFVVTNIDKFANWARSNSIWPLIFGTSCCAIEMMSAASAKYDWSRFGFEVARATPRQADLIIVAGTICLKMIPVLKRLYEQMPEPKYVIAMGACTISGGPFSINSYSVLKGVDKILPVDIYIPGCPPRPEALLHGMIGLQEKIKKSRAYVIDSKD